jgi:threonyl-tRNA synthetase
VVATITSEANEYATQVYESLQQAGIRAELDLRNEKINYKVRDHSVQKVPVMFVVGAREAAEHTVAIRRLGTQDQEVKNATAAVSEFVQSARPPY